MFEYMALEAKTSNELTRLVNEKMRYGWTPIGGMSVSITDNFGYGTSYCQAVTRAKPAAPEAGAPGTQGAT